MKSSKRLKKNFKKKQFSSLKCSSWHTDVWNKYTQIKNILFVKDSLSENALGAFNNKFHPSELPLNNTARSTSTYQLSTNNFKIKRYDQKLIVNKCTTLEHPLKNITTKFPNIKRDQILKQISKIVWIKITTFFKQHISIILWSFSS